MGLEIFLICSENLLSIALPKNDNRHNHVVKEALSFDDRRMPCLKEKFPYHFSFLECIERMVLVRSGDRKKPEKLIGVPPV